MVEHAVWDREAAGSSPVIPTMYSLKSEKYLFKMKVKAMKKILETAKIIYIIISVIALLVAIISIFISNNTNPVSDVFYIIAMFMSLTSLGLIVNL